MKLNYEVFLQIQHMQEQVIHVQQWLTDISATRGLDGLDDGFKLAKKGANQFRSSLPILQNILQKKLPANDYSQVVKLVSTKFEDYYETGLSMVQAFIETGTIKGNQLLTKFNLQAENLKNDLASLTDFQNPQLLFNTTPPETEESEWFRLPRLWKLLMERKSFLNYRRAKLKLQYSINSSAEQKIIILAQKLRKNIFFTQHALTMVSASRARDGMNDGFKLAEEQKELFFNNLKQFSEMVTQTQNMEWISLLENIEARYNSYYKVGLQMADAYITGGAQKGNKVMLIFDKQAQKLGDSLAPFIDEILETTGLDEFQVIYAQQALNEMYIILWFIFCGVTVLLLASGWIFIKSLQALQTPPEGSIL